MTTDIATLRSMRENLLAFRNSTPRSTGQTGFMKFAKGKWTCGKDNAPLDLNGLYLLHPNSLQHGWICWRDGKLFKEVIVPFTQQLPPEGSLPVPPPPAPDSDDQEGYQLQMAFSIVGIDGKQKGQQFLFKTGTDGGRKAVDKVVEALAERSLDIEATGEGGFYPVVQFGVDSYTHKIKSRGEIYTPVIEVVGWSTNTPGEEIEWVGEGAEEVAPPPPPPTTPSGRKRLARHQTEDDGIPY